MDIIKIYKLLKKQWNIDPLDLRRTTKLLKLENLNINIKILVDLLVKKWYLVEDRKNKQYLKQWTLPELKVKSLELKKLFLEAEEKTVNSDMPTVELEELIDSFFSSVSNGEIPLKTLKKKIQEKSLEYKDNRIQTFKDLLQTKKSFLEEVNSLFLENIVFFQNLEFTIPWFPLHNEEKIDIYNEVKWEIKELELEYSKTQESLNLLVVTFLKKIYWNVSVSDEVTNNIWSSISTDVLDEITPGSTIEETEETILSWDNLNEINTSSEVNIDLVKWEKLITEEPNLKSVEPDVDILLSEIDVKVSPIVESKSDEFILDDFIIPA